MSYFVCQICTKCDTTLQILSCFGSSALSSFEKLPVGTISNLVPAFIDKKCLLNQTIGGSRPSRTMKNTFWCSINEYLLHTSYFTSSPQILYSTKKGRYAPSTDFLYKKVFFYKPNSPTQIFKYIYSQAQFPKIAVLYQKHEICTFFAVQKPHTAATESSSLHVLISRSKPAQLFSTWSLSNHYYFTRYD